MEPAMMTDGQWANLAAVIAIPSFGFILLVILGWVKNKELDRGEMRRAMTGFFVLLFGLLVASSFFPTGIDLPGEIRGLFAGTITTLVGFYFGSRTSAPPSLPPAPPPSG